MFKTLFFIKNYIVNLLVSQYFQILILFMKEDCEDREVLVDKFVEA